MPLLVKETGDFILELERHFRLLAIFKSIFIEIITNIDSLLICKLNYVLLFFLEDPADFYSLVNLYILSSIFFLLSSIFYILFSLSSPYFLFLIHFSIGSRTVFTIATKAVQIKASIK